ncbi:unnamed protein product [Cunninghamella echinulata]
MRKTLFFFFFFSKIYIKNKTHLPLLKRLQIKGFFIPLSFFIYYAYEILRKVVKERWRERERVREKMKY